MAWNLTSPRQRLCTWLTKKNHLICLVTHSGDRSLQSPQLTKYLGVTINNTLTRTDHGDADVKKANKTLGFIWQVAGGSSTKALLSLYRSLVLPVLEYGLPAWSPYTAAMSTQLERVQRRATRMCLKQQRGAMPYEERLKSLNLLSLDARRNRLIVMFTMKCLFGLIHCPAVTSCTEINTRHLDTMTFKHHFAWTLCLKNSAIHTFPRIWSSLPPSLRNSVILESWKCFSSNISNYFNHGDWYFFILVYCSLFLC